MSSMAGMMRFTIAGLVFLTVPMASQMTSQSQSTPSVSVAAQYDSTHVYVAPKEVDAFVRQFLGTFGGKSTKPVVSNGHSEP